MSRIKGASKNPLKLVALAAMTFASAVGWAADGEAILNAQCSACHNLAGPAPATLDALWNRKGPDLFYAGNKYQAAWMEKWLQKPTRIRPAGMFYGNHIKLGAKGDEVDATTLVTHPALPATDAKAVTGALMQRKGRSDLVTAGAYVPGTISRSSGEMLFDKFKGCLACHEIEPGYGGLSGPEVYTAAKRLQENYLISYLRNPQAWDPKTFMPNKRLSDTDLQKFVHYLRLLGEEVKP
ncbi:MAG: c-type cytochrome [Pseudomonadota bacterium]